VEPRETDSAALVAAPDAPRAGAGGALSEPSREASPDVSPLAAEVQAWRASRGSGTSETWEVSRRKCAAWAVLLPVLLIGINAAVFLVSGPTIDPEVRAGVIALVTVVWLVFCLFAVPEFALLAIFGGGLSATPDGLRFSFGRTTLLLPWSDIESVAVEERTNTKGGSYTVLAIRFIDGHYRWPLGFSLWSSTPDRLCISPYILTDRAQLVADGLAASLDRHSDPAPQG
jgi:hypothetical protein